MSVTRDRFKTAREGAWYVQKRQRIIGGRVAVAIDGDRISCFDAGSARARKIMAQSPSAVAGVYDSTASCDQIAEDLLYVLSHD
ncbi:MAG: hypothetical protein MUF80_10375 [Burkholderiales bacterium]|nr:hypothetical protein [Vicinamibacteria bacterium]MCU0974341.1 hypothetical protein [Burkholderiales bacterium]